jgi:hypothetical protein
LIHGIVGWCVRWIIGESNKRQNEFMKKPKDTIEGEAEFEEIAERTRQ